jgi:hypothetical protein
MTIIAAHNIVVVMMMVGRGVDVDGFDRAVPTGYRMIDVMRVCNTIGSIPW